MSESLTGCPLSLSLSLRSSRCPRTPQEPPGPPGTLRDSPGPPSPGNPSGPPTGGFSAGFRIVLSRIWNGSSYAFGSELVRDPTPPSYPRTPTNLTPFSQGTRGRHTPDRTPRKYTQGRDKLDPTPPRHQRTPTRLSNTLQTPSADGKGSAGPPMGKICRKFRPAELQKSISTGVKMERITKRCMHYSPFP